MPSLAKDKEAEKNGATEEERSLYAMSGSQGWKVLSEYINRITEDLDNLNSVAIEKGSSFETIGQNTVVINLAKSIIRRIPQKVEDAKEACTRESETGTE